MTTMLQCYNAFMKITKAFFSQMNLHKYFFNGFSSIVFPTNMIFPFYRAYFDCELREGRINFQYE